MFAKDKRAMFPRFFNLIHRGMDLKVEKDPDSHLHLGIEEGTDLQIWQMCVKGLKHLSA
jgi:hypothetical protein